MDGYQRISKYKSLLLGYAILIVVYGHTLYYHSGLMKYEDLNFTIWYTLGSVEIFMFLSGFGIYQSLRRNSDAGSFYRKRLQRIFPTYLPVILVWVAFKFYIGEMTPLEALGNVTTLGFWGLRNQFNWYLPATAVMYLASPLFYRLITRMKRPWLVIVGLFGLIVALWQTRFLIAVTRFPTYFLGMYMSDLYARGQSPTRKQKIIWSVVGVAAMALVPYIFLYRRETLWYYGMYWIPFFFSTPACLWGTTWLMDRREGRTLGRKYNRVLKFLGDCSFEIYLVHLCFFEGMLRTDFDGWTAWICFAAVGLALGIAYHAVMAWATPKLERRFRKKTA